MGFETTGVAIADAMPARAADLNTDLIVMGAYGHPRWTERVLGGATRGLLASLTVPVRETTRTGDRRRASPERRRPT